MKKAAKLVLVGIVLLAGGAIAFAGAAPESYRGVSGVLADPDALGGKAVTIKATVVAGSVLREDGVAFTVEDERARLRVAWAGLGPLPEHEAGGSLDGRTVVLQGALARDADDQWVFRATAMQVGCASKYEPVADATA